MQTKRCVITLSHRQLFFPELGGAVAIGTFTGKWVQPEVCPGGSGGVELEVSQPGVTVTGETKAKSVEIDNGTAGKHTFICFVSSNNYLWPEVEVAEGGKITETKAAPIWNPHFGNIWKD
jgi:hypothetical protein